MTRRRARIAVVLLVATAVTVAGCGVLGRAGHGESGSGTTAPTPATNLPRRWVAPVTGWPSALASDAAGAVVLAGAGEVRALDRSGATRWRTDVAGAALVAPALDRHTVLVGAGARVVALDRGDGTVRWEAPVAGVTAGTVALAGGLAVAGTESGTLAAYDAATGEPRWARAHAGAVRSQPVTAGGVLVAAWHGGNDPRLRVFDLRTGMPRWDAPLAQYTSAPVAHRGLVVVGEGDGARHARVVARRLADGAEAWATPVPASFESGITPGAAHGEIAIVDHFGGLALLEADGGTVRHRVELDAPVLHTTLVTVGSVVALTTYGGELVLVDRRSGRVRHRRDPGGFPVAIGRSGADLLVALRVRGPGRVEARRVT